MIYTASILGMTFLVYNFIYWIYHIDECSNCCNEHGWGHFWNFLKEFKKYNWKASSSNTGLFHCPPNYTRYTQIDRQIIQFEGKGMILDYFSYLLFKLFMIKKLWKMKYRGSIKW